MSSPYHESIMVEPVLGHRAAGSLLYLPTTLTSLRTSYEAPAASEPKRRPKSTPRKPRRDSAEQDVYHPTNYLVRGGARAYEQKIQNMNRAAIQDLRSANDMLASELLRLKSCIEEERGMMRDQNTQIEVSLRMHQDKLHQQAQKLQEEAAARSALEAQHAARLKEVAKRLRDEHNLRTATQTELAEQKATVANLSSQVGHMRELHSEVARLEATLAGTTATVTELRSRLAATETKLELETAAKNDLLARHHANEAATASLTERTSMLATSLSEAEQQLRAAQTGLQALEDDLQHTRTSLVKEREAHAALRERSGTLQADLTQLQASSNLAAAQAAAEKAELERMRSELSDLKQQHSTATQDVSNLRDELLATKSELSGYKASSLALNQECTQLRDEARVVKAELESKVQQLSTAQYQADHHQQVFTENEALSTRLQRTESTLRQKESVLAETLTSHAAQLELWRAEATEVAQAAAKWKQRCMLLQQQVQARDQEVSSSSEDMRSLRSRCSEQEAELGRLRDVSQGLEARLATLQVELNTTKAQLKETLVAHASAARSAESSGQEAAQKAAAADMLNSRLADETAKTAALRQDLAAVTQQQVRELDAKSRMLTELTAALHKEERVREAAQREAASLRTHLQCLERELKNAQVALSSIQDDKLHAQEAYERAEAALANAHVKARHYKQENKMLLEQCNTWLGDVAQQQQQQPSVQPTPLHATHQPAGNNFTSRFDTPAVSIRVQSPAGYSSQPSPLKALEEAAEQVAQEGTVHSANIAAARHSPDSLHRAAGVAWGQQHVQHTRGGAQHAQHVQHTQRSTEATRAGLEHGGARDPQPTRVFPRNTIRTSTEFEGPFLVQPYEYNDAYSLMDKGRYSDSMIPALRDQQHNKPAFSFHVHAVPSTELAGVETSAEARAGGRQEERQRGEGAMTAGGPVQAPGTGHRRYDHCMEPQGRSGSVAQELPREDGLMMGASQQQSRAARAGSDADGHESSGSNTLERLQALLYST